MIVFIATPIIVFLCIIGYKKASEIMFSDMDLFFIVLTITFIITYVAELMIILVKPINYKNFKIEYDTVKQVITSSEDIRDTNYSMKLIGINTEINKHRAYIDSKWVGIFYNKKIAELELLEK